MIRGNLTYLRPVCGDDTDLLMLWENTPEFWYYTDMPGPFTREIIEEFIASSGPLEQKGQVRYIIHSLQDEIPLGAVDLFDYDAQARSAGVGILIADPLNRNQGYASDALLALIRNLETGQKLQSLRCLVYSDNFSSLALFRKSGFQPGAKKIFKGKEAIQLILEFEHDDKT